MDLWKGLSWFEGISIGWFLLWRNLLAGFLVGFVVGFIGGFVGIPRYIYIGASAVASFLLVWPIVLSQLLRKRFKGFRLEIVREPN
jgi:hypothetical protein